MAKTAENKGYQTFGGGGTSSDAHFHDVHENSLKYQRAQKILSLSEHQMLCHSELVSESKKTLSNIIKTAKKALAFTLAETLIVMGIIGVVAALTIPNLNSSTGEKEKVAKVKKIYSNLEDAFGRAIVVYGPVDEWFVNDSNSTAQMTRFAERITEFMKVSKNCKFEDTKACSFTKDYYRFITADGTAIAINFSGVLKHVYVDIDGSKGANTDGKDRFNFIITDDGIIPMGRDSRTSPLTSCYSGGGAFCTDWVLEMGNLDYLKIDTSGKCPNGKVLDWTTNTTCK